MSAAGDPPFVVNRSVTEHLEILGRVNALRARLIKGVSHADPLDWLLRYAAHDCRLSYSNHV
jgi:hypothetical protein